MTDHTRRPQVSLRLLALAHTLAATHRLPVLPLREKLPVGNCPACAKNARCESACGGRPNMKSRGNCRCPRPCHAWAAASTDPVVFAAGAWARAWREADAVGYHPGGAGLTVVDLDNEDAVTWARATLPPTLTVATTRGEHWLYAGVMRSANHVRPGVDLKSYGSHVRWINSGNGLMVALPELVRDLARRGEEATAAPGAGVASSTPAPWHRNPDHGCRHTERFVRTGLAKGLAKVLAHQENGAASQAFGVAKFLARQHAGCPGPCDVDTLAQQLVHAAESVGVPHDRAARAVVNGLADGHPTLARRTA